MSGVAMFDRPLGRPNLPVPDNLLEAHFSGQVYEHIEQPVTDRLFDRNADAQTYIKSPAFRMEGGGIRSCDIARIVNAIKSCLREIGVNQVPERSWSRLRTVPLTRSRRPGHDRS